MAGRTPVLILAPLLWILVGPPVTAAPAPQETVDTWLEERGDRAEDLAAIADYRKNYGV